MQMTPSKLIALRLFNITLGRSAFFSQALRKVLVQVLIRKQNKDKSYMASSRFFDMGELESYAKGMDQN